MRSTVFVLQFTGSAAPANEAGTSLTVTATAPSQSFDTSIGNAAVSGSAKNGNGGTATFNSTVDMNEDGSFREYGTIAYGDAGTVSFDTLGRGALIPLGDDGSAYGSVIWRVTSGTGAFEGISGTITSNFRVNDGGEVLDTQVANFNLAG